MGFYNVVNASSMQGGQPEDVSQVLANFNAIAAVLNGGIDDSNIAAAGVANLALGKLAQGGAGKMLGMNQTPALAYVPGMQEIMDFTVGVGGQASIDTNTILGGNIPQTFKHLVVEIQAREDGAVVSDFLLARLNNDSTAIYDSQRIQGTGAVATSAENIGGTSGWCGFLAGANATASKAGSTSFRIENYAQGTFHKQVVGHTVGSSNVTTGTFWAMVIGFVWRSVNAVTRLTLLPGTGNFVQGTRVSIYGVG